MERLLDAGRSLACGADLETMLQGIVDVARDISGARYAAITVPDGKNPERARFLSSGLTDQERSNTGDSRDRGILEVSIAVRGRALGTLYVGGGQDGGDLDETDRDAIVLLAGWAAVAIDSSSVLTESHARRQDLERALRTSRTAMEIATAIGEDTDLAPILKLIGTRARELVDADGLLIWLRHGAELRIAAVAGNADVPDHAVIPLDGSSAGDALRRGRSVRIENAQQMQVSPAEFGMSNASSVLIVPLVHCGRGVGVLVAFDRHGATASFDADNERALEAFAASAATAVATARLVEEHRLQDSMAAAESERGRWARELHDETLQGLASLKLTLSGALKAEPGQSRAIVESAVARLEHDIAALRAIIAELRPAALDELGLEPALRTLFGNVAKEAGLIHRISLKLGAVRLEPAVETIAYRIAQEALTNVVKHADARTVAVQVLLDGVSLRLVVTDDGRGVGVPAGEGYGIAGMRERAALVSGDFEIAPVPGGGTRVTLELPLGSQ